MLIVMLQHIDIERGTSSHFQVSCATWLSTSILLNDRDNPLFASINRKQVSSNWSKKWKIPRWNRYSSIIGHLHMHVPMHLSKLRHLVMCMCKLPCTCAHMSSPHLISRSQSDFKPQNRRFWVWRGLLVVPRGASGGVLIIMILLRNIIIINTHLKPPGAFKRTCCEAPPNLLRRLGGASQHAEL